MDAQGILQACFDATNNSLRISGAGAELAFVGAGGLELIAGTRTLVVTNDVTRLSMVDAVTTTFGCTMFLPGYWSTAEFGFCYTSSVTAAGNIRMRAAVKKHALFIDNISEAFLGDNTLTIDAPDQGVVTTTASSPILTGINVAPDFLGSAVSIIVSRIGADAADTYTGNVELIGIYATGS